MGTTGLTAQALGLARPDEVRAWLVRGGVLAGSIGCGLVACQTPIIWVGNALISPSPEIATLAGDYIAIRIWGAPAALFNFVLLGWFFGIQNTRAALATQVFMNGVNIVLDLWFVIGLGWGVEGVAWATLISEVSAVGLGLPVIIAAAALAFAHLLASWLVILVVACALAWVFAINLALLALTLFVATRNEITIRGGTMHLKGGEFHERVPLDTVVAATVVAASANDGLKGLKWRNGITLPGFRVGWYQRRGGRFVFVLATRASPLLHVVTDNRFDVLLGVDDPTALAERLLANRPEDRD